MILPALPTAACAAFPQSQFFAVVFDKHDKGLMQ